MTDVPERILAWIVNDWGSAWAVAPEDAAPDAVEYVRADLAAPSWRPIETAPEGEPHIRATWVIDAHTRMAKYFCVNAGYVDDDGVFVNMDGDDDFGWSADDYDWWAPMPMPLPALAETEGRGDE